MLMSRSVALTAVYAICFVVMYVPKALREEAYLRAMAGPGYASYATRTAAVLPRRRRAGTVGTARRFEWRRVRRHREWRTWVGVLALLAVAWRRAAGLH